jgi:hypothetical protein
MLYTASHYLDFSLTIQARLTEVFGDEYFGVVLTKVQAS